MFTSTTKSVFSSPTVKLEIGISTAFGCTLQGRVDEDDVIRLAEQLVAAGADEVLFNPDRAPALREQAHGIRIGAARDAVVLIADTRRRLDLNVSEELALEALCFRMTRLFNPA